jgi:hypothetical protein
MLQVEHWEIWYCKKKDVRLKFSRTKAPQKNLNFNLSSGGCRRAMDDERYTQSQIIMHIAIVQYS